MSAHTHDHDDYAMATRTDLRNHLAQAHTVAFTDSKADWGYLKFLHLEAHERTRDAQLEVAVTRKRLGKVLMGAYGEAPEVMIERVWAELQPEPQYQACRSYVDANGTIWHRLSDVRDPWRNCATGWTGSEDAPAKPLRLMGPLPTRDEVEMAVCSAGAAPGSDVMQRRTDRIMALLGQTDGDDHA